MGLYIASRVEVIDEIVEELRRLYPIGRTVIAVDALTELGQRAFADDLVARLKRAGASAFHADIAGVAESDFRRVLFDPFRMGGSTGFVLRIPRIDEPFPTPTKWVTGPKDGFLILTGESLLAEGQADRWNHSILLVAEPTPSETDKPFRLRSKITVSMQDPEHPRRLFADSC